MTSRMISRRSSRSREIYPEESGVMFHKASSRNPSQNRLICEPPLIPQPKLAAANTRRYACNEARLWTPGA
jgi:hypothetical protein